jgi:hypothetical protein
MLREFPNVRQIPGESKRRWFSDDYFDLIVWLDEADDIVGFQLCYDIFKGQRALTWHSDTGFSHHRVDDGESRPGKLKAAPVLVSDGRFDYQKIAKKFQKASQNIEERIAIFVYKKLIQYPA